MATLQGNPAGVAHLHDKGVAALQACQGHAPRHCDILLSENRRIDTESDRHAHERTCRRNARRQENDKAIVQDYGLFRHRKECLSMFQDRKPYLRHLNTVQKFDFRTMNGV